MRKKKSETRFAADIHAAYGIHIGDATDYGYVVGLFLNLSRIQSRAALAAAIGASVGMGTGHVPASLFEGVVDTPDEARELAFTINTKRDAAVFAAKAKNGLAGLLGAR